MNAAQRILLGLLAAAPAIAPTAAAQERQPMARPRIFIHGDSGAMDRVRTMFVQRRARLGVTVDLQANANDSVGATIESVTPGGPAAKAGVKSGDIITKLNGKLLVAEGKKGDEDQSLPGLRLVEIASQLKPNETVSVEYKREGARHTASLVTGDEPFNVVETPQGQFRFEFPRMEVERLPDARGFAFGTGPGNFSFEFGGSLMELQLAPLNPDLGQYFGTTDGVLVINVPKESTLGVKPGDVILSVDGRKVTGPSSLLRILRSYDPGDSFKLELMRNKSRTTVTGQLERHREK